MLGKVLITNHAILYLSFLVFKALMQEIYVRNIGTEYIKNIWFTISSSQSSVFSFKK